MMFLYQTQMIYHSKTKLAAISSVLALTLASGSLPRMSMKIQVQSLDPGAFDPCGKEISDTQVN